MNVIMICIVIQTLIAAVPALMGRLPRNEGFFIGLTIMVSFSFVARTVGSAGLLQLFFMLIVSKQKHLTFRTMMIFSLYCQTILLFGKIAAVCISLLQYSSGLTEQFFVIRLMDLSLAGEQFGWVIPDAIGKADIFTLLFILYLSSAIRSAADVPRSTAAMAAAANWILLVAVQRMVIELPRMVWS